MNKGEVLMEALARAAVMMAVTFAFWSVVKGVFKKDDEDRDEEE